MKTLKIKYIKVLLNILTHSKEFISKKNKLQTWSEIVILSEELKDRYQI